MNNPQNNQVPLTDEEWNMASHRLMGLKANHDLLFSKPAAYPTQLLRPIYGIVRHTRRCTGCGEWILYRSKVILCLGLLSNASKSHLLHVFCRRSCLIRFANYDSKIDREERRKEQEHQEREAAAFATYLEQSGLKEPSKQAIRFCLICGSKIYDMPGGFRGKSFAKVLYCTYCASQFKKVQRDRFCTRCGKPFSSTSDTGKHFAICPECQ